MTAKNKNKKKIQTEKEPRQEKCEAGGQNRSKNLDTRLDLRNAANSLQIEGNGVLPGDPYHWGVGTPNTRPYICVYIYICIYYCMYYMYYTYTVYYIHRVCSIRRTCTKNLSVGNPGCHKQLP